MESNEQNASGLPSFFAPGGDGNRILEHFREHPLRYVGIVTATILFVFVGIGVAFGRQLSQREALGDYLLAMDLETPEERAEALAEIAPRAGRFQSEVAYMHAETLLQAQELGEAKAAFQRLADAETDSHIGAASREALAWILEQEGNREQALAMRERVQSAFATYLPAYRQPLAIGRLREALGDIEGAKAAFEEQVEILPESGSANLAANELDRMRGEYPDLFPPEPEDVPLPLDGDLGNTVAISPEGTVSLDTDANTFALSPRTPDVDSE